MLEGKVIVFSTCWLKFAILFGMKSKLVDVVVQLKTDGVVQTIISTSIFINLDFMPNTSCK